ncbi:MAG: thioredoxin [Haloarculaceae archaeon]
MSDAEDADDVEAIRERKKEQLKEKLSAPDSPSEPVHVESAQHFQDVTGSGTVLVDFYADWCGPCKMLEPTVETIAAETDATVAKVDIDALQGLAQQYQVQGVPTLLLFVDGEPAERMVGVQDEATLRSVVAQHA